MIKLKNKKEISLMREAGHKLADVTEKIKRKAEAGVTTKELDQLARNIISKKGGKPSFLNYKGFPAAICTSINETVVHGVPSKRKLKEGDILSIDLGLEWKGYHSDMATTFPIGKVNEKTKKLLNVTKKSLDLAIEKSQKGNKLGDIGNVIESYVNKNGFVVVEGLCGHGIGKEVHEDPQVFNTGTPGRGVELEEGFVFCIEPMVTTKNPRIFQSEEGINTKNLSAHFEHTIAIVDGKAEILTALDTPSIRNGT
ncbi:MAG: type I methionyl aminopeptidase [Patescibacteria group bacterium]